MRLAQFEAFIAERGVVCDHVALAADAERRLGGNLDNADLSPVGILALVKILSAADPDLVVTPYWDALQAYGDFTAYFKAR